MTTSYAKIKANNKFNKANTRMVSLRLNYKTDADIISKLDSVESKLGYITSLIRKDLNEPNAKGE